MAKVISSLGAADRQAERKNKVMSSKIGFLTSSFLL
jgi:hypothetical protein